VRNTPELDACISGVLASHPVSHWTEVLDRHDVACDPVQTADQVIADAQLAALGQLEPIELQGQGSALLPRLPLGFSLTPAAIQGPPPAVGQHTWAVLREAGYHDAEIDDLLRCGICEGETECQG
jgi:crotonobetainyl-CoA:carnitine CoA-transferase CaiB-like acyl-CoA transferase